MPEHPLFEALMKKLEAIESSVEVLLKQAHDQEMAIQRVEGCLAGIERDTHGTDGIFDAVVALAEDSRRREWHAMLPAQARENIRRAS